MSTLRMFKKAGEKKAEKKELAPQNQHNLLSKERQEDLLDSIVKDIIQNRLIFYFKKKIHVADNASFASQENKDDIWTQFYRDSDSKSVVEQYYNEDKVKNKTLNTTKILHDVVKNIGMLVLRTRDAIKDSDVYDNSILLSFVEQVKNEIDEASAQMKRISPKSKGIRELNKISDKLVKLQSSLLHAVDVNIYVTYVPNDHIAEIKHNTKKFNSGNKLYHNWRLAATGISSALHGESSLQPDRAFSKAQYKLQTIVKIRACEMDFPSQWIAGRVKGLDDNNQIIVEHNPKPHIESKPGEKKLHVYYMVDCRPSTEIFTKGTYLYENNLANTDGRVFFFKWLQDAQIFAFNQTGGNYDKCLGWHPNRDWTQTERTTLAPVTTRELKTVLEKYLCKDLTGIVAEYVGTAPTLVQALGLDKIIKADRERIKSDFKDPSQADLKQRLVNLYDEIDLTLANMDKANEVTPELIASLDDLKIKIATTQNELELAKTPGTERWIGRLHAMNGYITTVRQTMIPMQKDKEKKENATSESVPQDEKTRSFRP